MPRRSFPLRALQRVRWVLAVGLVASIAVPAGALAATLKSVDDEGPPPGAPLDVRQIRTAPLPNSGNPRSVGPRNIRVLVVLLRWQGGDAAYLQPQYQNPMWRNVSDFWSRETYDLQRLEVTLTPVLDSSKAMPGCDPGAILNEGQALARAAGYTTPYDRYVFLSTQGCGMQWATIGTYVFGYMYVGNDGKAAHEVGHAFGLQHSSSSVVAENLYGVYGNAWEVMSGVWPELATWHFNAYDKAKLKVLAPLPCEDATLRPIESKPDAIKCGPLWAELHQDGTVWVFKEELTASNYGAADNTRVAILKPGQSYAGIRNAGNGLVNAKP